MKEELLAILKQLKPDFDFENCSSLIDSSILDSFDIVFLISQINQKFGVDITVGHLIPENFNSIGAMLALITRLKEEE